MRTFHCTQCQNLVFFENVRCLRCEHTLAFLPDLRIMAALRPGADGTWLYAEPGAETRIYRRCANYDDISVCNWALPAEALPAEALPAETTSTLCGSCRLNRVIPDLSRPANRTAWFRLEVAKRRMLYTLLGLDLPVTPQNGGECGLAFEFLEDSAAGGTGRVYTGHRDGVITVNIAEADDVHRERERMRHGEPYRTLLGHFRHEIGHYFWDRLILNAGHLEAFRERFGDERGDYPAALERHYQAGPPPRWSERYISAYASAHPWEDWAESFAHYLHMVDALETAAATGLALRPSRPDEPRMQPPADPIASPHQAFDSMVDSWLALTYVLNNLSRGLGLPDSYPFVLSAAVLAKLRFIHERIGASRAPIACAG